MKPGTTYKYVFFVETALSVLTGDPYESEVMWFTTKSSGSVSYKIGIIHDTDGGLWLNKTASTKYPLVVIPDGEECKVYPEKKSGKWVWVEYNGYEGYAYSTYIKYN